MPSVPIIARISAVARRQHGLVTRAQLVDLGVGRRRIEGWTAGGRSAITATTGYRIVWATKQRVENEPNEIVAELRALIAQ